MSAIVTICIIAWACTTAAIFRAIEVKYDSCYLWAFILPSIITIVGMTMCYKILQS